MKVHEGQVKFCPRITVNGRNYIRVNVKKTTFPIALLQYLCIPVEAPLRQFSVLNSPFPACVLLSA